MTSSLISRLDAAIGDGIEATVQLKHRARLRRLGRGHTLEPNGDGLWAAGDPPPRPGCALQVLIDGAEALPEVARAIEGARRSVHMTGWHVAPYFELVRGERPDPFRLGWNELTGEQLDAPGMPGAAGARTVQVVRTISDGMYDRVPHGDFRILESYVRALRGAQRLIYLENQFLWAPEIVSI